MLYMIFDIRFLIFNFFSSFFQFSLFQKSHFLDIFHFWLKTPQNYKSGSKTVKIINFPYYLSHFIKRNPLFDVDLFSRTFDMESPFS